MTTPGLRIVAAAAAERRLARLELGEDRLERLLGAAREAGEPRDRAVHLDHVARCPRACGAGRCSASPPHARGPRARARRARRARRSARAASRPPIRGPYQRQTRSGSRRNASIEATSNGSTSVQIPLAERKSGIPLSVDIPAPVSTTARAALADQRRELGGGSHDGHPRAGYISPTMDGYPLAHQVRVRFAETDAQGIAHHASFVVWLEEARVAYLAAFAGGYQAIRDGGIEALTTGDPPRVRAGGRLRRRARRSACAARRSAARAFATSTWSSATARAWPTDGRCMPRSTQPTHRPTRVPKWFVEDVLRAEASTQTR